MTWNRDDTRIALGVAALVATIVGTTCSTNGRFDDVNSRIDDLQANVNRRIDDVNGRIDDVQTDIRELRSLVIEAIKDGTTDGAATDAAAN